MIPHEWVSHSSPTLRRPRFPAWTPVAHAPVTSPPNLPVCLPPPPPPVQLREEELPELDEMARNVPYPVKGLGGNDNKSGKANVLMQVGEVVRAPERDG